MLIFEKREEFSEDDGRGQGPYIRNKGATTDVDARVAKYLELLRGGMGRAEAMALMDPLGIAGVEEDRRREAEERAGRLERLRIDARVEERLARAERERARRGEMEKNAAMRAAMLEELRNKPRPFMPARPPSPHDVARMVESGMTSSAIAAKLGIGIEAVSRARKKARQMGLIGEGASPEKAAGEVAGLVKSGLSLAEIAARLGKSQGTVNWLMGRAAEGGMLDDESEG